VGFRPLDTEVCSTPGSTDFCPSTSRDRARWLAANRRNCWENRQGNRTPTRRLCSGVTMLPLSRKQKSWRLSHAPGRAQTDVFRFGVESSLRLLCGTEGECGREKRDETHHQAKRSSHDTFLSWQMPRRRHRVLRTNGFQRASESFCMSPIRGLPSQAVTRRGVRNRA